MKESSRVRSAVFFAMFGTMSVTPAVAQDGRIYRCDGNQYTNKPSEMQGKNCRLVDGGQVSVIPVPAPVKKTSGTATAARNSDLPAEKTREQQSRDSDARLILEEELRKSERKLADLRKEYNNGEPEKLGPEHRNQQKYLDRVGELKASIERNESDIEGIRRELARLR